MYPLAGKRIWVAGHRGMVGAAVARRLGGLGAAVVVADRSAVDLTRQEAVERFVRETRPQAVVMAAAKVGGILANSTQLADFLYDNLAMQTNVMHAAFACDVEKFLFLGSSCIYPRDADQPIVESALLTGPLEPTNQWYAIAKIAGIKLGEAYRRQHGRDYISAMPTNLYGPGDNFDLRTSHVLPALIRKAHEAKTGGQSDLEVWGTGSPRREFMHVDDCADALAFILANYSDGEHINVGAGEDLSIAELARLVCRVVGFEGKIRFDTGKPDGTPRKLMSSAKLRHMGWKPRIDLERGIAETYAWFLENLARRDRA